MSEDSPVVIVTGAAGFLGSAITAALDRQYRVVALDRREPSVALRQAAPGASWKHLDIGDAASVAAAFAEVRDRLGQVDFVVHFAAFYHFGTDELPEYRRTNVDGTAHLIESGLAAGAARLLFASSIAALEPPLPGAMLDGDSPPSDYLPYARSKAAGERMVRAASGSLPAVVLRIGGAFSDWCELPPLHSLIMNWWGRGPLRRIVVGRGETGMPYVHRDDLVRLVRACIEQGDARLGPHQVLMAAQHGTVRHQELFDAVRRARGVARPMPLRLSPAVARIGLALKRALGAAIGRPPFERDWMLRYVDRPWVVDATAARDQLGWVCPGVAESMPRMLDHLLQSPQEWARRNQRREAGDYQYQA